MIIIFLSLTVTLFFCFGCYLIYRETVEDNIFSIQYSFHSVLYFEGEVRLEKSGMPSRDSVLYINKNNKHGTKPMPERRAHAIQTALMLSGYPMKATIIDSLLTGELRKLKIYADIGIRYVNNPGKKVEDSKPGNSVYYGASTALILLGLNDEIGIQAFYRIPFLSILRQAPIRFVLFTLLWLAILSALIVLFRKKNQEKVVYIPLLETNTTQNEKPLQQISSTVYYDQEKSRIRYKDQSVFLSNQLVTLFTALLNATDHYLNNDEIEKLLWPKKNNSHEDCIQIVKRLREALKPVSGIKIKNVNRKGYQLEISI